MFYSGFQNVSSFWDEVDQKFAILDPKIPNYVRHFLRRKVQIYSLNLQFNSLICECPSDVKRNFMLKDISLSFLFFMTFCLKAFVFFTCKACSKFFLNWERFTLKNSLTACWHKSSLINTTYLTVAFIRNILHLYVHCRKVS